MSKSFLVASAAFLSVFGASAALAQSSYGTAVTLGYNNYSSDNEDADGGTLQVETDLVFGNASIDLDVGFDKASDSGDEVSNLSTELLTKYWFSQKFGVGAYFARDSLDLDVGDVANFDSYGLEGTYREGGFEGSAFVGRTDLDELADDVDVNDIGLRLRYDVSEQFSIFGNGVRSRFEAFGNEVDANGVGLGAQYAFGNGLAMFGGYQNISVDGLNADLETGSIGVNYATATGGTPVILSGEYARIEGDAFGFSDHSDRLSVSATVLFGGAQGKRIPGTAVTGSLLKSDRNAIAGLLSGIGF